MLNEQEPFPGESSKRFIIGSPRDTSVTEAIKKIIDEWEHLPIVQGHAIALPDNLQAQTGAWADTAFPESTHESIGAHLVEEVIELLGVDTVFEACRRHWQIFGMKGNEGQ